ncbi:uncharacterized protein LOC121707947 [Alosa sapidissima]|uniref:uncharacterized protein LOC121707947 n=1 Tax=Alosa sapidissima TaxID=34773 RepID=UPI001C09B1C7|nr:uncharacterized protein LOC121707947 [Alosa sapidissima]
MGILFRHLTIVQLFLWGFKDVAFVDLLTISGETVLKLNSELSLNCSSDCASPIWDLNDDSLAEVLPGHRSSHLTIKHVTTDDEMKYTCRVKCGASSKKESVKVTVYSLDEPVLISTPQTPWSGQPFTVTCELRDFYPATVQLLLSHNDTPMEVVDYDNGTVMTAMASNQLETTSTNYKCNALMTLGDKIISTSTDMLVQPKEFTTTFATSTQQHILSSSYFRPGSTEDDLQNLITKIRETTVNFPYVPTESSTAEGQHKHQVAAETTAAVFAANTEQNILSTSPVTDLPAEVLITLSETEEVQTSSTPGGIQPSVGLYVLTTLGAVASIVSMGTALFLVLCRKRKRRQEKTEDQEEVEMEKEKQQLPEMSP